MAQSKTDKTTEGNGDGAPLDDESMKLVEARDRIASDPDSDNDEEMRVGGRLSAIAITAQKNALATYYGTQAPYGALFTADPGTTGTVTGEVTGGAPAYARKAITWGAASNGVITGTATFDVPAGSTVTFAAVTVSITAGTADLRDRIAITSQAFATQGTLAVTFTYTQT